MARSTDGGAIFGPNVRLDQSTGWAAGPNVVVAPSGAVLVTWWDSRYGQGVRGGGSIFLARSTDDGLTFPTEVRVDDTASPDEEWPAIAAASTGEIYVIWEDDRPAWYDTFFLARSLDGGLTFSSSVPVPEEDPIAGVQEKVSLNVLADGTIWAAWDAELVKWITPLASASHDGGQSFPGYIELREDPPYYAYPRATSSATDGATLYVGWIEDMADGWHSVWFDALPPGSQETRGRVRLDTGEATLKSGLSIAASSSGDVFAAWIEHAGPVRTVRFTGSDDGRVTFGPVIGLDDVTGQANGPTGVGLDPNGAGGDVFVTWAAFSGSGNQEILLDHITVTTATSVGEAVVGPAVAPALSVSPPVPNPVRGSAVFEVTRRNPTESASLLIHDVQGREVWRCQLPPSASQSTPVAWESATGTSSGLYVATVTTHGERSSSKFLVLK